MLRSSCQDVVLFISRRCFRARAIILWFFLLGLLIFLSILFVILTGPSDASVNWTYRRDMKLKLRQAPYGRSQNNMDMVNHKYPDYSLRKINVYKNKQSAVDVDVPGNGDGDKTKYGNVGAKRTTLNKSLKISIGKLNNSLHSTHHGSLQKDHKLNLTDPLGCEEIATLTLKRRVGRGTTKDVYASDYNNTTVAVKMVSPNVADIRACLRRRMYRNKEECFVYANYKIMKEIALAQQLQHPSIAKLIGYCIQSDPLFNEQRDHGVISVVEFGAKASLHRLFSLSWNKRLQAAISLADLLDYLENSPLGSMCIWDYKHSQFVVTADNQVKYSDLDDLSGDEPECTTEEDCIIPKSNRIRVKCSHSRCHGFNAKFNLLRTTKEFFRPLISNPPPEYNGEYNEELDKLFEKLKGLQINAKDVKRILTEMMNREKKEEIS